LKAKDEEIRKNWEGMQRLAKELELTSALAEELNTKMQEVRQENATLHQENAQMKCVQQESTERVRKNLDAITDDSKADRIRRIEAENLYLVS
jgi:uncharacterized protein YaaN involved in tellurite resistance